MGSVVYVSLARCLHRKSLTSHDIHRTHRLLSLEMHAFQTPYWYILFSCLVRNPSTESRCTIVRRMPTTRKYPLNKLLLACSKMNKYFHVVSTKHSACQWLWSFFFSCLTVTRPHGRIAGQKNQSRSRTLNTTFLNSFTGPNTTTRRADWRRSSQCTASVKPHKTLVRGRALAV